jgi:hypothetical protein
MTYKCLTENCTKAGIIDGEDDNIDNKIIILQDVYSVPINGEFVRTVYVMKGSSDDRLKQQPRPACSACYLFL